MADRAPVAIRIGGMLRLALLPAFLDAIEAEGALADWDGARITQAHLDAGTPLYLVRDDVDGGRFEALETFCKANALPFARWRGGNPGAFDPERLVFDGACERVFDVNEENSEILVPASLIRELGTTEALLEHLAAGEFAVPALRIVPADD
ncbi:hypothetical protein [Sphingomonas crocodyli]|uniref:Uncharacterized protein n=1 Tax=Sphingomonas crocodyli TaxID=1979270 RepID=A0A437LY15_9SPHN|nr:hypothetical protein [Sphingomonas crocodyli]RVT90309.1 hypothetical protein EOD43_18740 [Sphingomonas crocodyli]